MNGARIFVPTSQLFYIWVNFLRVTIFGKTWLEFLWTQRVFFPMGRGAAPDVGGFFATKSIFPGLPYGGTRRGGGGEEKTWGRGGHIPVKNLAQTDC